VLFKAESKEERFFSSLILYVKSRLVLVRMNNEVVFLLFSFLFESKKKEKKRFGKSERNKNETTQLVEAF
jgi:hypothetical protein